MTRRPYPHSMAPRNFYFDIGANNGDSVVNFLGRMVKTDAVLQENQALDGSHQSSSLFADRKGVNLTAPWTVVAVEPNNKYTFDLEQKRKSLEEKSYVKQMTLIMETAVTSFDGTIEFISDAQATSDTGNAGATIMQESRSAVGMHYSVKALDILTLLKNSHIRKSDFVVLKLVSKNKIDVFFDSSN